jgi:hypothetical protein
VLDPQNNFFPPVFAESIFFWEIYGQAFKSTVKKGQFWAESTVTVFENVATQHPQFSDNTRAFHVDTHSFAESWNACVSIAIASAVRSFLSASLILFSVGERMSPS